MKRLIFAAAAATVMLCSFAHAEETEDAVFTRAFPVSSGRAVYVENENAKSVLFWPEDESEPQQAYVIGDDTAHLRLELPADDDPGLVTYYNGTDTRLMQDLLDAEQNAYIVDQPVPDAGDEAFFVYGCITSDALDDADRAGIYLIPDEESIEKLAGELSSGGQEITWEYGEPKAPKQSGEPQQAYVLHAADQDGEPVQGLMVNFCTDTACTMKQSDENGLIVFDGEPDIYHVQLLKAPEGYSFDPEFEMYTEKSYGEWLLRIRKD